MINLGEIQTAVDTALKNELQRARAGRIGHVRGSVSRFLLQEEITSIAKAAVNSAYDFDIRDLSTYADMHPDFLLMETNEGPLKDILLTCLVDHITKKGVEKAQSSVLLTNMPVSPQDVLADIEDTIALAADLGSLNKSRILQDCVTSCYEEPSVEAYDRVAMHTEQLAAISKKMTFELDIADPPRAYLAGTIYRRLSEAADQLRFMLKAEPAETFEIKPTALAV